MAAPPSQPNAEPCPGPSFPFARRFAYDSPDVKLRGTIEAQTFPGPPNYQSVENGDAAETYWILNLEGPICTLAAQPDPDGSQYEPAENNVSKMQLMLDGDTYQTYRSLLGKPVTVTGSLFHAFSAHHRTALLLQVTNIEP